MNPLKSLRIAASCALILALLVVMLGAYTRLTNAGLGCPDWPGCYGHMILPTAQADLTQAQGQYPLVPIETVKAWTEMVHRYAAGSLAVLILSMALTVFHLRKKGLQLPWVVPFVLLFLVAFQAALGMWTVTLKLLPVVVMGHLLGGILIFSCLCYFRWQLEKNKYAQDNAKNTSLVAWISVGVLIVFCQIALGGWVSSNYAGIACIGFPQCNGQWLPALNFSHAFNVFSSVGANYQGGILDHDARMTIQFVHRIGAFVTAVYVLVLSTIISWRPKNKRLYVAALLATMLVIMQFILGVINVTYLLPLWAAVVHNGMAALLLATMVSMRYLATRGVSHAS